MGVLDKSLRSIVLIAWQLGAIKKMRSHRLLRRRLRRRRLARVPRAHVLRERAREPQALAAMRAFEKLVVHVEVALEPALFIMESQKQTRK